MGWGHQYLLVSRNFLSGNLRSCEFRDLTIMRLWRNMKMFAVSHKSTKTTQFFQDHSRSPHLWCSGCSWWSGVTGRSSEVTWRHSRFSPVTRDRMKIETHKWCQTMWLVNPVWKICILTYLGHDLTLNWPDLTSGQVLKLTFQGQEIHFSNRLDKLNTMV